VSLGEKIKGKWWKFRPVRHVAATYDTKHAKKKLTNLSKEIREFLTRP